MEQFHAAPTSQWNVITKMIDECDFYLLVVGGRYGPIDEETGISYTEKEYNYAENKGLPVLVLIKQSSAIAESEKDTGEDKYDKMKRLDEFRDRVKNDENTVDFFTDLNSLKYVASPTFRNAISYVDDNAGWVRYQDIVDVINEEAEGRNKANAELIECIFVFQRWLTKYTVSTRIYRNPMELMKAGLMLQQVLLLKVMVTKLHMK